MLVWYENAKPIAERRSGIDYQGQEQVTFEKKSLFNLLLFQLCQKLTIQEDHPFLRSFILGKKQKHPEMTRPDDYFASEPNLKYKALPTELLQLSWDDQCPQTFVGRFNKDVSSVTATRQLICHASGQAMVSLLPPPHSPPPTHTHPNHH